MSPDRAYARGLGARTEDVGSTRVDSWCCAWQAARTLLVEQAGVPRLLSRAHVVTHQVIDIRMRREHQGRSRTTFNNLHQTAWMREFAFAWAEGSTLTPDSACASNGSAGHPCIIWMGLRTQLEHHNSCAMMPRALMRMQADPSIHALERCCHRRPSSFSLL